MAKCLVVDSDAGFRTTLQRFLQRQGEAADQAADGPALRRKMAAGTFDVVILDTTVCDDDGLDLCRWIQGRWGVPVIALAPPVNGLHKDAGSGLHSALNAGAEGQLRKPVELCGLLALLHGVLCRGKPGDAACVAFADWRFDRVLRRLVSASGAVVVLSDSEARLLSVFVEHAQRVLSRRELVLLTRAPGVDVNERGIDLAVSRLRRKLGDAPRAARLIRTLRGRGYVFAQAVATQR